MAADVMAEPGWVYMVHPETGGAAYFPNSPDVLVLHEAKGWEVGEEPADDDTETDDTETDEDAAEDEGDDESSAPATKKPSTAKAVKPATDKEE